jgi:hypothetical protein
MNTTTAVLDKLKTQITAFISSGSYLKTAVTEPEVLLLIHSLPKTRINGSLISKKFLQKKPELAVIKNQIPTQHTIRVPALPQIWQLKTLWHLPNLMSRA